MKDNGDGKLEAAIGAVSKDGEPYSDEKIQFVNDVTRVEISKVDAATEQDLAGAVLQVVDQDGTVVEKWTSDGSKHVILAKLAAGKSYQLVEVSAPKGYEIADPITFTVKEDGTADPVVMKDAMIPSENASVSVTKQLVYNGELVSAIDQTFYVALFGDAECTKRISEVKAIEFKNASASTVTFNDLDLGRTYYVAEVDGNGDFMPIGVLADDTVYEASFNEGYYDVVVAEDGTETVIFQNTFDKLPEGFYRNGELTITKKLIGPDNNLVDSDEVFYAGIFADAGYTVLSDQVSQNIVELNLAGGSQVSAVVNVAITEQTSTVLYVTEVDANGVPVKDAAGFKYEVSIDNTSVTLDETNMTASVTITNKENREEETETETEEQKKTGKENKSVKTGDDTPFMQYVLLLLAAAAVVVEEVFRRRRKAKKQ